MDNKENKKKKITTQKIMTYFIMPLVVVLTGYRVITKELLTEAYNLIMGSMVLQIISVLVIGLFGCVILTFFIYGIVKLFSYMSGLKIE